MVDTQTFSTSAGSTRGHADCRAREAGEDEEEDADDAVENGNAEGDDDAVGETSEGRNDDDDADDEVAAMAR